jgi:UDP-glucose 4-epimerase
MNSKRALVTGGCGFIGSHVVRELVDNGYVVDVVDDMGSGSLDALSDKKIVFRSVPIGMINEFEKIHKFENRKPGSVLVLEGDFASSKIIEFASLRRWEIIFHLAAEPRVGRSIEEPYVTNEVNVNSTLRLMQSIIGKNVNFIFSSSSAIYGPVDELPTSTRASCNPQSPYGLQKQIIEQYLQMFGHLYNQRSVCLRYFNVYGPGQNGESAYSTAISAWCTAIHKSKSLRSDGDGSQTRDLVFVKDIARANRIAAESTKEFYGEVFNIGCGESFSNNQILEIFKNRFNSLDITNAPERQGDVKHTLANIEKTTQVLGWKPEVLFVDGLNLTLKWWGLA